MIKPLVSIIMGVYNAEKTIDRCVQSIIDQTYSNWEFVICDDCSNDETYNKILKYKKQYPQKFIILKNKKNMKLAQTLNRCLEVSKGKYIARMDADDIALLNRLERQVSFLIKNTTYDVVGSSVIVFGDNGDKGYRKMDGQVEKKTLLTKVPFIHPTIMMKKECYDKLGGYTVSESTSRGQDKDLWFRFFSMEFKGYNLAEPLLRYYENLRLDNKKSLKRSFYKVQVLYKGYKLLKFPKYKYIFLLKPIFSAIIPHKMIYTYHKLVGKTTKTSPFTQ